MNTQDKWYYFVILIQRNEMKEIYSHCSVFFFNLYQIALMEWLVPRLAIWL